VQRGLLEEHPWVALELFKLFQEAKLATYERAKRWSSGYLYFDGRESASQAGLFGDDPYPYGIKQNREMLELLFRISRKGGLTQKLARIENLFYPTTLDT
jgi:4,5-dihydroxyphthalate decarboxylase